MRLHGTALFTFGWVAVWGALAGAADDVARIAHGLLPLYYDLHRQPELSLKESKTSARIAAELKALSIDVTTGVGGNGVVGVLRNGKGPTLLLRTDMDALPVKEATGLSYASKVTTTDAQGRTVGVMHACGHDLHMTVLIGTAKWLATHRSSWKGTVLFVAQPAEELAAGARAMLDAGLYSRFGKPDFALALHATVEIETGTVAYRAGAALASDTSMTVTIKGRGGHGAMPNKTVDPIVLAAAFIVDMQTIVSREMDPTDPAVITVGSIQGGTKHNIIPDTVELRLTIRSFSTASTTFLIDAVKRHARGLAEAHHAPVPEFVVGESSPPLINDATLAAKVLPALQSAVGANRVFPSPPFMAAEDFGEFGRDGVPVFMFWLGTIDHARMKEAKRSGHPLPALHSSLYYPDPEPSVATGVRAMIAAACALLH